jgi:hypothetical protein
VTKPAASLRRPVSELFYDASTAGLPSSQIEPLAEWRTFGIDQRPAFILRKS